MARVTKKAILKQVGSPYLDLHIVPDAGGGRYVYFEYDAPAAFKYDTRSVMVPRLSDMSIEQWVAEGKALVAEMEQDK